MNPKLIIEVSIQVQKPIQEVFNAIVLPEKMSNYFISKSTGPMEEGKNITWKFPDYDGEALVRVVKVEKNKYISFYWGEKNEEFFVEISLSNYKDSTVVKVTEKERNNDVAGIAWLKGNTEGWANFLACLKCYAEHGINLRKGAFDYRFDKHYSS